MKCTSMVCLSILWNGEQLESFKPSHEIRQGNLVSTYVFVLCMEVLSQLIFSAVDDGSWHRIKLS